MIKIFSKVTLVNHPLLRDLELVYDEENNTSVVIHKVTNGTLLEDAYFVDPPLYGYSIWESRFLKVIDDV